MIDIRHGDCLDVLRTMPDNSVDSVCTDPPYGLSNHGDISAALTAWLAGEPYQHGKKGFMGKDWDGFVPGPEVWREVLRVLKPGGHALVFAGTRTVDLMGIALRLAGFEVRDSLVYWGYATGFPKSHDISKAIDRMAGAEREVVGAGQYANRGRRTDNNIYGAATPSINETVTAPATPEAQQWDGWGTALKPAFEPILLVRKPLAEKTIAANVLAWGCGGLNIDGCRIPTDDTITQTGEVVTINSDSIHPGYDRPGRTMYRTDKPRQRGGPADTLGRWPANLLLDEPAAAELDAMSGERKSGGGNKRNTSPNQFRSQIQHRNAHPDYSAETGGASRFFFVAKASAAERTLPDGTRSSHLTMKPLKLMQHLVKLITPPGGVCLDPFAGSGTTGMACVQEGYDAILIEREAGYVEIARRRVAGVVVQREMEIA